MKSLSDEIADIFAYLLSIVNVLNLDLTSIFVNKMVKNREKYPITECNGIFKKKK
jgi:NTP pyrophosphatase (non-canonical NTP hydrolase)